MRKPTSVSFVLLSLTIASWSVASPLSDAVSKLSPGDWVELTPQGLDDSFTKTGGNSGIAVGYSDSVKWDPATGQLFYIGMDHNEADGERFIIYSEAGNTWTVQPQPAFAAGSGPGDVNHEYDHTAIDSGRRYFYYRYGYSSRSVYRYHIDQKVWTQLPDNDVLEYSQCCGALEFFPELDGIVWVQAGETIGYGGIFLFTEASNQWVRLGATQTYAMGAYHNFAELDPVSHKLILGGGNGSRDVHALGSDKSIKTLPQAPIDLGVHQTVATADAISGQLLVFTADKEFWTYDAVSEQWAKQDASKVPIWTGGYQNEIHGVVAGPVSTYGVNAFVSCEASGCRMYAYKHSPGEGTPWDGGTGSGASGSGGSSGGGNGGAPSAGGSAMGGASGSGLPDGGPGTSASPSSDSDGGCGCRTRPGTPALPLTWLTVFAALLLGRRRDEGGSPRPG
ncbi:MAG: MYXO-CTERM sorting domain-containing protein [Polyangiaceae bacterium]